MSNRLSIVFYVAGMPFEGDTLVHRSLGGSETAGLCMAREMCARGHEVTVFSNTTRPGKYDGVNYLPLGAFHNYMAFTTTDVLVAQRAPQIFQSQMKSKLNILWMHDLGLKRMRPAFKGALWNVDEVWGVSKYHINQLREVYGGAESLYWATRNGVDLPETLSVTRQPKRLIYAARPERGLDILLYDIMPKLWAKDPDIELCLAGYDNTVPEMKAFYDGLFAQVDEYRAQGRNVRWLGHLTKQQLYKEYQQSALYVYPTKFEEVSCITAMECMANGLGFIGTRLAALPETLGENTGHAQFIDGDATTPEYQEKFVESVLAYLSHYADNREIIEGSGHARALNLTWKALAADWESHLYQMFAQRTANKDTLAAHFYRNEDIMALRHLNASRLWNARIETEYPFIENPALYAKTYKDGGAHYKEQVEAQGGMQLQTSVRFKTVLGLMKNPKRVLDYGGAYGNEAVQFVNNFNCDVTTVNIIEAEQELGRKYLLKHCNNINKIQWVIAEHPDELSTTEKYDIVFGGEILEHLWAPWEFVDALEKHCTPGGQVIFTVPLGPWGDTDLELKHRGHLWSFERMDLKEMFRDKKDLSIKVAAAGANEKNKEMMGWFIVSYTCDGAPTGKVNLDRKVAIQSPRQTLSACMIVGGAQEGLLHRCLKSIHSVADEILIADTGMTPACHDIIAQYPKARRIPTSVRPLQDGFDEARNASIKEAKGDWILWIDSDEELLNPENIYKYLRSNNYQGYSIRQHHFSAQPPGALRPDLPVRMFRNGKGIKFYGVIHEHPETGLNESVGEATILADVDIAHDGYLTETGRRKRFDRNIGLMFKDREKYPERLLGKFLMMRDWLHLIKYTMEQLKGQVTPECVEWAEAIIATYRKDFLGQDNMFAVDGLEFYSAALAFLGRGMEYAVNIDVRPNEAQLNGGEIHARFENVDEFNKFLSAKLRAMCEPYEGRYV